MPRIAILLAACGGLLLRADEFEIKVYLAEKAAAPVVLDGRLDEPAWRQAVAVGGFTLYGKDTKAAPPTFWKATYDDRRLYLAVVCDEPALDRLQPLPQARDAHAVFRGETIEIFLDPGHSHSTYYQFAVSAAASMYDSRGEDPTWNAAIEAAAGRTPTGWILEFAVPWDDLGVAPTPGLLCGINVCRDRQLDGKQWTNWARVIQGFHDPARFGHLVLSPPPRHPREARPRTAQGRPPGFHRPVYPGGLPRRHLPGPAQGIPRRGRGRARRPRRPAPARKQSRHPRRAGQDRRRLWPQARGPAPGDRRSAQGGGRGARPSRPRPGQAASRTRPGRLGRPPPRPPARNLARIAFPDAGMSPATAGGPHTAPGLHLEPRTGRTGRTRRTARPTRGVVAAP